MTARAWAIPARYAPVGFFRTIRNRRAPPAPVGPGLEALGRGGRVSAETAPAEWSARRGETV